MKPSVPWRAAFSSLEHSNFRWFWFSATATAAVMQMNLVVRGLLVWDLTGSYADVGMVSFAAGVPMFFLSLYGGAIADRVDKRNLLIATQVLMSAILLCIAILILLDMIAVWHLAMAAVGNGVMMAFNLPARNAIVPQLVTRDQVMNAVALNSSSQNLNRVLAPGAGGLLIGLADFSVVYFVMFGLAVLAAVFMIFVRLTAIAKSETVTSVVGDVIDGIRKVSQTPSLRDLLLMLVIPVTLGMPYMMQLAPFASDVLGASEVKVGFLYSAIGIGSLIGSIIVAMMGDYRRKGLLLFVVAILFGVFLVLLSQSHAFYIPFFVLMGVGMANAVYLIVNNTLLLMHSDEQMRGRVMGLFSTAIAFYPLSVWPLGEAMDQLDPRMVFAVCGGLMVMAFLVIAMFKPGLSRL